jgi:hypothetical protein
MVMDLSWVWASYRDKLPQIASDRGHDMFVIRALLALAVMKVGLAVTLFWYLRSVVSRSLCSFFSTRGPVSVHSVTLLAGIIGLFAFAFSSLFAFSIVPATAPAAWAWCVFFLWTYSTLFVGMLIFFSRLKGVRDLPYAT